MRLKHLAAIAAYWDAESQHYAASHPEFRRAELHPSWGLWHLPEDQLQLTLGTVTHGSRVVELGCGIGHDAIGFAARGAKVIAVDISLGQLRNSLQHPSVLYVQAPAERLPIADETVDAVISDHGAFDHSPAEALIAECHRVLKPAGILVVCTYSPIAMVCFDPQARRISTHLHTDYPDAHMSFDGESLVSEHSYSSWIKAFRAGGFVVERLEEPLIESNSGGAYFDELIDVRWSQRWPIDIMWVLRKMVL